MPIKPLSTKLAVPPTKEDPYVITKDTDHLIRRKTFAASCEHLRPGFVLSAAVVGSGELIATTSLGARAGFVMFWIIILSCLVKVSLQLEWGKHVIHSGETTMTALNKLPGKKFGRINWSIWLWLFYPVI